jgi:hypothetical protein
MDAPKKSTAAVESTANDDPFADLSKLRLTQDFVEQASVKKLLTTVWVRKPSAQDFVRVHPDAAFRDAFAFVELKDDDREHYLVMPEIAVAVADEVVMKMLYTTINRQGTVSLWPVRLPTPEGRVNEWHRTAQEAAARAVDRWIRIKANLSLGAYEIFEAPASIPDPVWPEHTFDQLLRIGFKDKLIQSLDHPVLKRLRGEC